MQGVRTFVSGRPYEDGGECGAVAELVLPPMRTLGWTSVRAMFVIYLVGITAGLVYFTTIGLLHH